MNCAVSKTTNLLIAGWSPPVHPIFFSGPRRAPPASVSNWNNADRFVKGVHFADGLLIGANKHKGRDWLGNSAGSNSQQPQVNAALDANIVLQ